ncbi:hypothetical protein DFAR_2500015 [Desulfarculales bacterium]
MKEIAPGRLSYGPWAWSRAGRDLAVATPIASGKILVYALPVLEGMLAVHGAKTLFLFSLKALKQDQLQSLNSLAPYPPAWPRRRPSTMATPIPVYANTCAKARRRF